MFFPCVDCLFFGHPDGTAIDAWAIDVVGWQVRHYSEHGFSFQFGVSRMPKDHFRGSSVVSGEEVVAAGAAEAEGTFGFGETRGAAVAKVVTAEDLLAVRVRPAAVANAGAGLFLAPA